MHFGALILTPDPTQTTTPLGWIVLPGVQVRLLPCGHSYLRWARESIEMHVEVLIPTPDPTGAATPQCGQAERWDGGNSVRLFTVPGW
jgi:hypothetical protein